MSTERSKALLTARNLKLSIPTDLLESRNMESEEIYPETDPFPYYIISYDWEFTSTVSYIVVCSYEEEVSILSLSFGHWEAEHDVVGIQVHYDK